MQPDTTKIWTRSEVRVSVGKIIVESLGIDEAAVTDAAAVIRDLGAESIDFLDMSFKCQQTFGVDLPVRLVQDRRIEWRDLRVLAKVIDARYGVAVAPEELRTVAPATIGAILEHLAAKHGIRRADGDEGEVVRALAVRMLADLDGTPLDLSGLTVDRFAGYLRESLHAPAAIEAVMSRFTLRAVGDYSVGRLGRLSRASFRHFVRPGDQLRVRCELRSSADPWVLAATADVDGRRVATATLEYALEAAHPGTDAAARAARLGALARELQRSPLELAARGVA